MIEAMKLRAHLMPFLLACCSAQAQNIVRGEYWIDTDPGIGAAIPFAPALIAAPEIQPTSITVPMGYVDGLPVGVNLTSAAFTEQLLLDVALAVEECTGIKDVVKEPKR